MFSAIRAASGDHSATSSTPPTHASGLKFPAYLLPSFTMPFRRRRQSSLVSASGTSTFGTTPPSESAVPDLSSSPTDSGPATPGESPTSPSAFHSWFANNNSTIKSAGRRASLSTTATGLTAAAVAQRRLSRTQPNTIRCSTCATDFAYCSQVVSKGFTGRYGRAYLIAPSPNQGGSLLNIKIGKSETRLLVTGSHVVADITCAICQARVGWKYVDAKEESQKYKVGKFILETQRIVDYRSWEDVPDADCAGLSDFGPASNGKRQWADAGDDRDEDEDRDEEVVLFDSEDEDDCDDLFSGSWDPAVAARRRARKVNQRSKTNAP